jgi:hypothetical protein
MHAVFPGQHIAAAVGHAICCVVASLPTPCHAIGGNGNELWFCHFRACARHIHRRLHVRNPPGKRCEILDIDDVPTFLGGIPACPEGFDGVFLCEGCDQIDSHGQDYAWLVSAQFESASR